MEVVLSRSDCVRWDPAPYPKRGRALPNFRPTSIVAKQLHGSRCHLVRRQTSAYVTLCLMWTQLPQKKGHTNPHPIFGPCLLWPNGWMDEHAAWYRSRPRPRPHCTTRDPSSRERGTAATPPTYLVTGQLADTPTHGLPTRGLDNSRSRRCRQKGKLSTRSRRWHPQVVQSATCPVRELSSLRVDQSASRPVRELAIRELAYPRVVQ